MEIFLYPFALVGLGMLVTCLLILLFSCVGIYVVGKVQEDIEI